MRSALGFLTVVGGAAPPDRRAVHWFGPVGALVGLTVGGVWWASGELWTPLIAAVLAVAVDAALTGMLHLDGLADSADGLLPPLDRERRLDAMAAPDVGAFGVVAVAIVLLLRTAALASVAPEPLLVAGLWAAARAAMALTMAAVRYARAPGGGAASGFAPVAPVGAGDAMPSTTVPAAVGPAVAAIAAGAVLASRAVGVAVGLGSVAAALLGFAAVVGLAQRRLGGYTGDVLGAAGVVAETVGLLAVAAQW
jgi:adenosylcobinamide-GDP ribazoletransferase